MFYFRRGSAQPASAHDAALPWWQPLGFGVCRIRTTPLVHKLVVSLHHAVDDARHLRLWNRTRRVVVSGLGLDRSEVRSLAVRSEDRWLHHHVFWQRSSLARRRHTWNTESIMRQRIPWQIIGELASFDRWYSWKLCTIKIRDYIRLSASSVKNSNNKNWTFKECAFCYCNPPAKHCNCVENPILNLADWFTLTLLYWYWRRPSSVPRALRK